MSTSSAHAFGPADSIHSILQKIDALFFAEDPQIISEKDLREIETRCLELARSKNSTAEDVLAVFRAYHELVWGVRAQRLDDGVDENVCDDVSLMAFGHALYELYLLKKLQGNRDAAQKAPAKAAAWKRKNAA